MKKVEKLWKNHLCPLMQNLFFNTLGQLSVRLFGTVDKRSLKYDVSLCLIFKNEGLFLQEWIDYHLTVGVDHFYL